MNRFSISIFLLKYCTDYCTVQGEYLWVLIYDYNQYSGSEYLFSTYFCIISLNTVDLQTYLVLISVLLQSIQWILICI